MKVFRFNILFSYVQYSKCVVCKVPRNCSMSGNDDVTRIGESFHRAQLKINCVESRRFLNRIFGRTGSTQTVLPVFGCNFSLATGKRRDVGPGLLLNEAVSVLNTVCA